MGWSLTGKRVAFTPTDQTGSYAQFAIAESSRCLPIDDKLSFEHASMTFVNPLTALAMLEITQDKNVKSVIITAAASALGRMLNRLFRPENIQIINIVRRE